jgi:hypothetical protein
MKTSNNTEMEKFIALSPESLKLLGTVKPMARNTFMAIAIKANTENKAEATLGYWLVCTSQKTKNKQT